MVSLGSLRKAKKNGSGSGKDDIATPSSNLRAVATPNDVDWSSFPEGSYSRFGHHGDWWTLIKGTIAILFTWGTWLGGIASPFWMVSRRVCGVSRWHFSRRPRRISLLHPPTHPPPTHRCGYGTMITTLRFIAGYPSCWARSFSLYLPGRALCASF